MPSGVSFAKSAASPFPQQGPPPSSATPATSSSFPRHAPWRAKQDAGLAPDTGPVAADYQNDRTVPSYSAATRPAELPPGGVCKSAAQPPPSGHSVAQAEYSHQREGGSDHVDASSADCTPGTSVESESKAANAANSKAMCGPPPVWVSVAKASSSPGRSSWGS